MSESVSVRGYYGKVHDIPHRVLERSLSNACEEIVRAREIAKQSVNPRGLERLIHNQTQARLEAAVQAQQGDLDKCIQIRVVEGGRTYVEMRTEDLAVGSWLTCVPWPQPFAELRDAVKPAKRKRAAEQVQLKPDTPVEIVCGQRHPVEILWRGASALSAIAHVGCGCGQRIVRLPHVVATEDGVARLLLESLEDLSASVDDLSTWIEDLGRQIAFSSQLERALRRVRKSRGVLELRMPKHLTASERRLLERVRRSRPSVTILVDHQDEP